MQPVAANVDQLTGRRKPSRVSGFADRLEDQASEHEKCDKQRKPNQQFQHVGSQDMRHAVCQDFHYMKPLPRFADRLLWTLNTCPFPVLYVSSRRKPRNCVAS